MDKPPQKIIFYLIFTAVMVITFISAMAISKNIYSAIAWLVLLVINLGGLVYLLRK